MEVNRSNFDVLVKSVFVEQHRTPSMCHKEPIRQVLVVKIFKCFLQGDDVPLPCNVFVFRWILLFHVEVLIVNAGPLSVPSSD